MPMPPLDQWMARAMHLPADGPAPTPEALRRWQLAEVRATLAQAKEHSPFYARHLAGVRPDEIRGLEDLGPVPRTTPDDLRQDPDTFLCVSRDEVARPVTLSSSGSSGPPKRLFFGYVDLERTRAFFSWGMRNLAQPGDTVLVMLPGERADGVGQLLVDALARFGARGVTLPAGSTAREAASLARDCGATVLVGAAAHIHALAAHWRDMDLPAGRIHSVLLCWDAVSRAARISIERTLGCRVLEHWGMTETGLGGAVECEPGSGLHLREADLYVEITNPATGRPMPDGEYGEITVTTLRRRAMPLVRYRSGDLGRILTGACDCASPLRRLDRVAGRIGEGLTLYTGEPLNLADLDEALYALPGLAQYSAELHAGGDDPAGTRPAAPLTLTLRVAAPDGEQILWSAQRQAMDVGPVRRACEAGALRLHVAPLADAPLHFAKRRITFSRNEAAIA